VSREVSNAFACSPEENWQENYHKSPSEFTTDNVTVSYAMLINREGQSRIFFFCAKVYALTLSMIFATASRDVTDTENNTITFEIPIHVLNIDTVLEGLKRDIAFSLRIGDTKLWTGVQEITIGPPANPFPSNPNAAVAKLYNNVTDDKIFRGNSAVFRVTVTLSPGWSNFDVEVTGDPANGKSISEIQIILL
jgi:hypothetical protein